MKGERNKTNNSQFMGRHDKNKSWETLSKSKHTVVISKNIK